VVTAAAAIALGCAAATQGCAPRHNAYASHRSPGPAFEFRNDLPQTVGVYARRGGGDGEVFLRFVEPARVDTISLRGFRIGQTVRLRAVTVSGDQSFDRDELVVENAAAWRIP
jgi:hypothetical protein